MRTIALLRSTKYPSGNAFRKHSKRAQFSLHPKNVIFISCARGINVYDNDNDREKIADVYNHDRYGRRW